MKLHIKKGDIVKVLTGDSKGSSGRVLVVYPKKCRAIVEGVNKVKKHSKPSSKNTQGGIIEKEASIHISNLAVIDSKGNTTRIGRKLDENTNKLVRYSKKSGEVIK